MHEAPPTPPTPTAEAPDEGVVHLARHLAASEVEPPAPEPRVPALRSHGDLVVAEVDDRKVGEARLLAAGVGWGVRVYVHPAWRRQGLGLQLLREVARVATSRGLRELDVRLDAQDLAGLRLVLASGLCGSISCDGGQTRTRLVLAREADPAAVPGAP